MNEIQRPCYINLAVSSDSPDERMINTLSFYRDFPGMTGMEAPVHDLRGLYEDQQRALAPFGDLYDLAGLDMDVEVHMLSGAEPGPESTCIDLQRYRRPV